MPKLLRYTAYIDNWEVPLSTLMNWIEPVGRGYRGLWRRAITRPAPLTFGNPTGEGGRILGDQWSDPTCPGGGVHEAIFWENEFIPVNVINTGRKAGKYHDLKQYAPPPQTPMDDPDWPKQCAKCNYEFSPVGDNEDLWITTLDPLYTDGARMVSITQPEHLAPPGVAVAPPGSAWDAWWAPSHWRGKDGLSVVLRLPGGHDLNIDAPTGYSTYQEWHAGGRYKTKKDGTPAHPGPNGEPGQMQTRFTFKNHYRRWGHPRRNNLTVDPHIVWGDHTQPNHYSGTLVNGVFTP